MGESGPASGEFREKFIQPIINACWPGTLAGLAIAGLALGPTRLLRLSLALSAIGYLTSSFAVFFYTIYPSKRRLWSLAALSFLFALTASLFSVVALAITEW
ncbi:MAG TPA: hypothetical protein VLY82_01520 [Nitrososphaerales archaeon]|nr:hypothetical protein [Nitrososphaerales archaeon]